MIDDVERSTVPHKSPNLYIAEDQEPLQDQQGITVNLQGRQGVFGSHIYE